MMEPGGIENHDLGILSSQFDPGSRDRNLTRGDGGEAIEHLHNREIDGALPEPAPDAQKTNLTPRVTGTETIVRLC